MEKKPTLAEWMEAMKENFRREFPGALMACFAGHDYFDAKGRSQMVRFTSLGPIVEFEKMARVVTIHDDDASSFVCDVFLDYLANQDPRNIIKEPLGWMYNDVLEYANELGKNVTHRPRYKEKKVRPDAVGYNPATIEENKPEGYVIGQSFPLSQLEENISILEEELNRLRRMREPGLLITLIKNEAKRLRKAGKEKEAKAKEAEADEIVAAARADLAIRERKEKQRKVAIDRLVKARAVRAAKIEEDKRKAEQAERDRQKAKQSNPQRAAKAKMAKIKARQEERKAMKKKGKEVDQYAR